MIARTLTALLIAAAVAGCVAPASTPAPASSAASAVSSTPTRGAEQNCLAAVAKEVGVSNVTLIRSEFSQAATEVYVQVPGAQAPWLCLASKDGTVSEVRFTGSEGAL